MSSIFPIKQNIDTSKDEINVVDLDTERAEVILDALSSRTTRDVFISLYENPQTISELSESFDESIQGIKYHVEKLHEADLIMKCGTHYSEKGNEMDVYAPTREAVVLVASEIDAERTLQKSIKKYGSVSTIVGLSAVIMYSIVDNVQKTITVSQENNDVGISTESIEPNTTNKTVETFSDQIAIGAIEASPEVAVTIALLCGAILGILTYVIMDRVL